MQNPTNSFVTYHGLCYTSCVALVRTIKCSLDPPKGIDPSIHDTAPTSAKSLSHIALWVSFLFHDVAPMGRRIDPSWWTH